VLLDHPKAGQATSRQGVRRVVLTPYPYVIFYRVTAAEIVVMRFRHTSRKPR
jgi:toxin ParE1/3/4